VVGATGAVTTAAAAGGTAVTSAAITVGAAAGAVVTAAPVILTAQGLILGSIGLACCGADGYTWDCWKPIVMDKLSGTLLRHYTPRPVEPPKSQADDR
jgi:hypothetical protein